MAEPDRLIRPTTAAGHILLEGILAPPDRDGAACAGVDPELFFPDRGDSGERAVAICHSCPHLAECREYGMDEEYGIWGGLTERNRARVKRGQEPVNIGRPCRGCGKAVYGLRRYCDLRCRYIARTKAA
jgi:WhiB family redox-sensing transcriptional regulator